MKKYAAISTVLFLAACSSMPGKSTDNREWLTVSCSGAAGWKVCFDAAQRECPKGFDIANKQENLVTGLRSFEFACKP